MKLYLKKVVLSAGMTTMCLLSGAQSPVTPNDICINEVMQSTFGGELDMLMEYPDSWVELYNPTSSTRIMKGFRIGKKDKFSKCYELPDIEMNPKTYLVIYCDKEDTVIVQKGAVKEIHADFKLTTDKESGVYLYNSQGILVDSLHLQPIYLPGVGYGRLTDASDSLGLEMTVTRGKANAGGHGKAVLPYPVISPDNYISPEAPGGKSGATLMVRHTGKRRQTISNGEPLPADIKCHYTLDGSEPTVDSPILEKSSSIGLMIRENTMLRTAYFLDGYVTPPSQSHLYLLHGREINIPVVALAVYDDDLYDSEYGIFENQPKMQGNDDSQGKDPAYKHDWRRPVTFTFFERGGGDNVISQKSEMRVSGGYTRLNDMKSVTVYANNRFGTPDNFEHNFWSKTRGGISAVPSLTLRTAGNDQGSAYMRDAIAQLMIGSYTDVDWQAYQPAIYYINDKYQGVINIRERGNEDNVWTHNDSLTDITLIEITQSSPMGELKQGDYELFREFYDFCSKPNQPFEEYEKRMDVVEYTNMMICHIFFGNTDFPANNYVQWRPNTEDGRWRWIIKDVDRAFNIWNSCPANGEYLKWILRESNNITFDSEHNSEVNTLMFRNLINTVPEYRDLFIDHLSVYMGDFLNATNMKYWINFAADQIRSEVEHFSGVNWGWNDSELNNMKNWGADRVEEMYKQLQQRFSLGKLVNAKVNDKVARQESQYFDIKVNGVHLTEATLNGKLYAGREYVFEGSHTGNKYEITGWTVSETKNGITTERTEFGSTLYYTPSSSVTSFSVNAIRGVSGIEDHEDDFAEVEQTIYYNTQGVSSSEPFPGMNIVRRILSNGQSYTEKVYYNE